LPRPLVLKFCGAAHILALPKQQEIAAIGRCEASEFSEI